MLPVVQIVIAALVFVLLVVIVVLPNVEIEAWGIRGGFRIRKKTKTKKGSTKLHKK